MTVINAVKDADTKMDKTSFRFSAETYDDINVIMNALKAPGAIITPSDAIRNALRVRAEQIREERLEETMSKYKG